MDVTYINWGGAANSSLEQYDKAVQEVYQACLDNSSCEIIELRTDTENQSQSIIVEFGDGSFETDNPAGIQRVERLSLTFSTGKDFRWEVRALRKDFPATIHQNHVPEGEPRSLCLYIEPWVSIIRSWTPQLFLIRIFWWLRATAEGTIHGDDQPIEHLFFSSSYNVLLPENHFKSETNANKKLSFVNVAPNGVKTKTLIGKYSENTSTPLCLSISMLLDSVENGPLEEYPYTLGQLQEILEQRNSNVVAPLKLAIEELALENGIECKNKLNEFVLLLLGIPRSRNGNVEKIEIQGFIIETGIALLGEKLSVLFKSPGENKWYRDALATSEGDEWKTLQISPVNVRCYPSSKEIRSYSGLNPDDEGPKGIIAGIGALGGLLAVIWRRECWGKWLYVDNDIIQAHNTVRHISTYHGIGFPKSVVVSSLVNDIHQTNEEGAAHHLVTDILSDDKKMVEAINDSNLLVDATTTLHVPREISQKDHFPRTASLFITPSGITSVLLLENANRTVRCNSLEAQYYRAILDSEWGANHLVGHYGRQWVGAGCREVTLSMSDEFVHLHAATLARQLRKSASQDEAKICIWEHQEDTGGIIPYDIPVFQAKTAVIGGWDVIWDNGFLESAKEYRTEALPNETGGILFGIIDQKDKTILVVKACPAPENSEFTPSSFKRAAYHSTKILAECHERTAGMVTYIGEWHSHPPSYGALPSQNDIGQLKFISTELQSEGMPALIMILAESSAGFYLNQQGKILDIDN